MFAIWLLVACGVAESDTEAVVQNPADDLDMRAEDFPCMDDMTTTGRYRYTNLLGYDAETAQVAASVTGGVYPVGTLIQLIPTEAMVKRKAGWNASTSDWEFFALGVSAEGTVINARGGAEVENAFNGQSCLGCHSAAAPEYDLVCGEDHGCAPLGVSQETIQAIQANDARCN